VTSVLPEILSGAFVECSQCRERLLLVLVWFVDEQPLSLIVVLSRNMVYRPPPQRLTFDVSVIQPRFSTFMRMAPTHLVPRRLRWSG
jgi:hypothetical protein